MEMQWPATVMAKRAVCDAPKYGMLALAATSAPTTSPREVWGLKDTAIVQSNVTKTPTSPRQKILDAERAYNDTLQEAIDEFYRIHEDLGLNEDLFHFGIGFWKKFLEIWDEVNDTIKDIPDAEEDKPSRSSDEEVRRKLNALKFELNYEELSNPAYSGLIFLLLLIFASVNFCVQNSLTALAPFVPTWMKFCFREALVKKQSIEVQQEMNTTMQDTKEELKEILVSLLKETGSTSEDSNEQGISEPTDIPNPVRTLQTLAEKVKGNSLSLPKVSSTDEDTVKSNAVRKALAPAEFYSTHLLQFTPGTTRIVGGRLISLPALPSHVSPPPRVSPSPYSPPPPH